jgi:Zn-dependent metalloprotease
MRTRSFCSSRPSRSTQSSVRCSLPAVAALALLGGPLLGCGLDADPEEPPAVAPANPDAEGRPLAAVMPHWDALVARTGGPPAVRWSALGTPMAIFGALTVPRPAVSADEARGFLADHAGLLQLSDDLAELDEDASFASPLGSHVRFVQRHQGIRVHGAEVKVHFDRDGRIIALNNTSVPRVRVGTDPAISAARALELAVAAAPVVTTGDPDAPESPELVIYAGAGVPALAYRVVVPTGGPTLEYFVSAKTGALLGEPTDLNRYVDGTGQVFKDNAVVATQNNNLVDGRDAVSAVPTSAYSIVTLQGLNGNNRLDGQFASGAGSRRRAAGTNNTFNFLRNTAGFNETMAYFHFDFAQRYIQSLGFTNVNNRQQVFAIDRLNADNSFYSPNNRQISLGTGGVDDAEDGEVIVHEYGHSVQDNQVPGFGTTVQGGAMGEGFGDYLAGTVNAALTGEFQITCIAEWDATSYAAGVPHCLRRLDTAKRFPQDAVNQVHADGEIWSAALFQIRGALGAAKADRVIIQSHFLLSANANFADGSNAIVTAAINLGLTATEVQTVRTILRNRGFTVTA